MTADQRNFGLEGLDVTVGAKSVEIVRCSAKPMSETARIRIPIKIERTKRLEELTPDDIPPGLEPEDVATDAQ